MLEQHCSKEIPEEEGVWVIAIGGNRVGTDFVLTGWIERIGLCFG